MTIFLLPSLNDSRCTTQLATGRQKCWRLFFYCGVCVHGVYVSLTPYLRLQESSPRDTEYMHEQKYSSALSFSYILRYSCKPLGQTPLSLMKHHHSKNSAKLFYWLGCYFFVRVEELFTIARRSAFHAWNGLSALLFVAFFSCRTSSGASYWSLTLSIFF